MKTFKTRADMLAVIPPNARVAEIGVFLGEFSDIILTSCKPRELFLVDMWEGSHRSGDKDGRNVQHVEKMPEVYIRLWRKLQYHGSVRLVRSDSKTFFEHWEPDYFDAVYIDADHTYEGVMADLLGAYRVTKTGGFIMGHDYHAGVAKAVSEFCKSHGQAVEAVAQDGCPSFMIRLQNKQLAAVTT
jgi:hypothetical protein